MSIENIIMLRGSPQSGKSLSSRLIKETSDKDYTILSVATVLRNKIKELYGKKVYKKSLNNKYKDIKLSKIGLSPRDLLILLGNTMKTMKGKDVIVKLFIEEELSKVKTKNVIIDDIGFDYEVSTIRDAYSETTIRHITIVRDESTWKRDSRTPVLRIVKGVKYHTISNEYNDTQTLKNNLIEVINS